MRRFLSTLFFLAMLAVLAAGGAGWWWVHHPLRLSAPSLDLSIEPGTLPRGVARAVHDAGVDVDPRLLYAWFRASGQSQRIKAGSYELDRGITPLRLLEKLARGEESLRAVTLVEGWNFHQFRAALGRVLKRVPDCAKQLAGYSRDGNRDMLNHLDTLLARVQAGERPPPEELSIG